MAVPVAPVTYQIWVNGVKIPERPLDIELRQSFGKHDLFFVRIEYPRLTRNVNALAIWPKNAPVLITWGRGATNMNTWFGYLNHHQIASNADSGSRALQVTYWCIGTSKPMNSETTRTWGQSSPTYMAKQIFAEHGLRAVLTSSAWVSDYEVQSAETDFRFLNRMAAKYGYRAFVSGGTGYFIDPAVVLAGSSAQGVPIFRQDKRYDRHDTVRDFQVIEGDNIPGSELATRALSGVDQDTGLPFTVTATGTEGQPITKLQTGYVARSVAEGQVMADSWQNSTQFFIQARAELYGNVLLYPGKVIYLQGQAMPGGTSGYWMVCAADHVLKSSYTQYTVLDRFVTRVRLIRNQDGPEPNLKAINVIRPEFVPCTLNSGLWTSSDLTVLYDGVRS